MYDINLKNVKKGNRIFIIFLTIGALLLAVMLGVLVQSLSALNNLDSATTSTKVEIKSYINDDGTMMYSPVYYYSVNGHDYVCGSSSSSSIYPGTTNALVYYDSQNPENCITEYSKSGNWWMLIAMLVPLIFIIVAIVGMRKISKRIAVIKELNRRGKLVKNLPYHLENTGTTVNGVPIQRPVTKYTLPSGFTVTLRGDPRYDRKTFDSDGMVDLIIDENNPENYFIDFEINRLSGNLPTDYYNRSNEQS